MEVDFPIPSRDFQYRAIPLWAAVRSKVPMMDLEILQKDFEVALQTGDLIPDEDLGVIPEGSMHLAHQSPKNLGVSDLSPL